MSVFICLIPAEEYHDVKFASAKVLQDRYLSEVSGETHEEALKNLVDAINNDQIDTENCLLKIYEK